MKLFWGSRQVPTSSPGAQRARGPVPVVNCCMLRYRREIHLWSLYKDIQVASLKAQLIIMNCSRTDTNSLNAALPTCYSPACVYGTLVPAWQTWGSELVEQRYPELARTHIQIAPSIVPSSPPHGCTPLSEPLVNLVNLKHAAQDSLLRRARQTCAWMRGTQPEDYARLTREAVAVRAIVPVRTPVSTRKRTQ